MKNLHQSGNTSLLFKEKTAFLCSRRIPDNKIGAIYDWANRLSAERDCIICGNHSQMEQEIFHLLLDQKIPAILVLAEGMRTEWNEKIKSALDKGHLLIITACDENIHHVSSQSAYDRNNLILSIAEHIVIGYSAAGGNIDRQIAGKTNVTFLNKTQYLTIDSPVANIAVDCNQSPGSTSHSVLSHESRP